MTGKSKFQISRSLDERIKRIINGTYEHDSDFAQVTSAYILGFNYGNVTNCVGLTTNYQLHHAVFPVVGLVFFKTSPTDEDIKSSLSTVKEYSSSPNGLGSFKSDKNEHLFLIYSTEKGFKEVEKRIFNFTKGTFVRRRRLRLNVLDDPYCPRQVHKGPEELFNLDDDSSSSSTDNDHIDHLIFFIHGVGGVCDVRFRSCVEVVADFRKMANNLLSQQNNTPSGASSPSNKHLAQHLKKGFFRKHSTESSNGSCSRSSDQAETSRTVSPPPTTRNRRVECLPISWHSCTRRQTGINDQLNLIALSSVPRLRHFLNKVVMDALLYCSGPVYSQTIINNVGDEINRLYSLFMEKHPNFNGSVSLAGHSLGSVIVFDLLAHQVPDEVKLTNSTGGSINNNNNNNNNNNDDDGEDDNINTINNNNNNMTDNINNNNGESNNNNEHFNCRQNCLNVSHNHHDLIQSESASCMNYKNLEELLKDMDLIQYAELFHKEHIDVNTLLLLTDLDMKELNLPLGARRKLGTYINFKKITSASGAQTKNTQQQPHSTSSDTINHSSKGLVGNLFDNMNTGQHLLNYPQLKFKPRCFFAFGSPTPMFLNVRGIQNISSDYKLPTCDRMFNIFHPYDPLAYRMEPLIDPRFKNVEPILIPHHRGGKRIHVQLREGFARVGNDIKHRLLGSLRNTWSSFTRFSMTTPETSRSPSIDSTLEAQKRKRFAKSTSSSVEVEVESFDSCPNPSTTSHSNNTALKQKKRALKKQQPLLRSHSDLNLSGIDHISDHSSAARQSFDVGTENGGSQLGPDAIINHFDALNLNEDEQSVGSNSNTEQQPSTDAASANVKDSSEEDKNGVNKNLERDTSAEFDPTNVGRLNGGRRIDYVLQEKPIELFNEYIFAFTSHANYWQNEDSALIILNEIYGVDSVQIFDYFE